jgi:hypothetical protein
MTKNTLSKIEVAYRQLDIAIKLWFQEWDPIAIHTLVCSSHQIISDIIHYRGGSSPLFDNPYIKNGFEKIAKRHFHKYYNFFKHANHDPDMFMEFNSSANEYFIGYSIFGLEQLGIKHNLLRRAFMTHFAIHHPRLLTEECIKLFFHNIPPEHFAKIRAWTKQEFFDKFSETFPYLA